MTWYVSVALIFASILVEISLPSKSYSYVEGKECATQLLAKTEYVKPISIEEDSTNAESN